MFVIRNAFAQCYKSLFSLHTLLDLLKNQNNGIEYVRDINMCHYVNGKRKNFNDEGPATETRVMKNFTTNKATIQFHQPQRFIDVLWKIQEQLETWFGCLVGSNVYITHENSQGLAPHYDDVEVPSTNFGKRSLQYSLNISICKMCSFIFIHI